MKICYLFDALTGVLSGDYVAQESPEEPGEYITPTHSTFIEPPGCVAGQVPIFKDGTWTMQHDHRGTVWYDAHGVAVVVDTIDLPAGLIAEQPPAMVAAQVLADRIAQLKADLSALDFKKIRPLAEGDAAYLATLNAQSATLRAELATL
jgi:hypothetical protein